MPATKPHLRADNPFLIWINLGWKTAEMMTASAQVINHRTNLLAASGSSPSAASQREFTRMGQEKLDAALASFQAMGARALTTNYRLWQQYLTQLGSVGTSMLAVTSSRTLPQLLARQQELARVMLQSATTAARLSDSTAKLATRGLKPVHSTATANARRLGR